MATFNNVNTHHPEGDGNGMWDFWVAGSIPRSVCEYVVLDNLSSPSFISLWQKQQS